MKVLRVQKLTLPDNDNIPDGVVPILGEMFEAEITVEQQEEIKRLISEAEQKGAE